MSGQVWVELLWRDAISAHVAALKEFISPAIRLVVKGIDRLLEAGWLAHSEDNTLTTCRRLGRACPTMGGGSLDHNDGAFPMGMADYFSYSQVVES
jgi:hypothetical protein